MSTKRNFNIYILRKKYFQFIQMLFFEITKKNKTLSDLFYLKWYMKYIVITKERF